MRVRTRVATMCCALAVGAEKDVHDATIACTAAPLQCAACLCAAWIQAARTESASSVPVSMTSSAFIVVEYRREERGHLRQPAVQGDNARDRMVRLQWGQVIGQ
jgi:hypothetical protein